MENNAYINSVNLNAKTDFPYLFMEIINNQSYPMNPGFRVMHWHEDIQFIYVLSGDVSIKTLQGETVVLPGEAVFINKNVVHLVAHEGVCHYYSFVFPDYFLKFYFGSPAAKFVDRITGSAQLSIYLFSSEISWSASIRNELEKLIKLEKNKSEYYSYEVLTYLSNLWLIFCENLSMPESKTEDALNTRMQTFLQYIDQHYSEEISLDELAKSANVSKSECMRCFKKSVQMTP